MLVTKSLDNSLWFRWAGELLLRCSWTNATRPAANTAGLKVNVLNLFELWLIDSADESEIDERV